MSTSEVTAAPTTRFSADQLRTMTVAARLYHVQEIRQRDIADRLGVSQARVSRLLRQAEDLGIVRTVLMIPEGLYPDLEEQIEQGFGIDEVHVVEVPTGEDAIPSTLGRAAAHFFAVGTVTGPTIGFTSWSTTLQEMSAALGEAPPRAGVTTVVEMLGDLGSPKRQHAAARATQRLADMLGAEPLFLRTPGVVSRPELREAALQDPHVQRALTRLDELDVAFVGVGPAGLHSALRAGDNFFDTDQLARLDALGVAGQLDQRFIDADGRPVETPLDELVVGVTLDQLARARRRVVVAGGASKHAAIAAALGGGWIDSLMTDVRTARYLVRHLRRRALLARM